MEVKMKCIEADIIRYMEGKATKESKGHIEGCKKCSGEVERLKMFSSIVSTHYAKGKSLEKDLDKRLASINLGKMKRLPPRVAVKVEGLKGKSLADRLKKVVRKGEEGAWAFLDGMLSTGMHARPASPKDLTKVRKKRKTKKKI
jgi:hypothetical protein